MDRQTAVPVPVTRARRVADAIWKHRWKIVSVLAVHAVFRGCKYVAEGWPREVCEVVAKLLKVVL